MAEPFDLDRRRFLIGSATGALSLALGLWKLRPVEAAAAEPAASRIYVGYQDLYRERWRWDRVEVGTHTCTNCASGGCAWRLYVRDDVVWREEQGAIYGSIDERIPDYNPRGCQKGAAFSELIVGPARPRHPLRRVGTRGGGRWKRIAWSEALDEVASSLVETLAKRGGGGVLVEQGNNADFGPGWIAMTRFFSQIGVPITDNFGGVGDLPVGSTLTLGIPVPGGSSDDWFRTDYFVNWHGNPDVTKIPDAHFIHEARYRGATIVSISPDHSPTAIHADLWIPVRPGSDAALALAACKIVIDEGLYAADYVREQTDLPFLVRSDSRRYLRESDVVEGGRDDLFACWDERQGQLCWAPGSAGSPERTLRFANGQRPALEVQQTVRLASGDEVGVRSVWSLLRSRLDAYDLGSASKITGVHPHVILRFARGFAAARAALIYAGATGCKLYHGDLMQRSQILLASLTGNHGRPGGGWRMMTFFELDGLLLGALAEKPSDLSLSDPAGLGQAWAQVGAQAFASPAFVSGFYTHLLHGGLREAQTAPRYGDPSLPRTPDQYLTEALAKSLVDVPPLDAGPPEVIFNIFGNAMRNVRRGERIREVLWSGAKLIVSIGLRMDEATRHADILLPVASAYEKLAFKYCIAYPPYLHLGDRAVPPGGETKPEWEIFSLLARRVAEEARRRNLTETRGYRGQPFDVAHLDQRFSDGGRLGTHDQEAVMNLILRLSPATQGITLAALRANGGALPYTGVSPIGRMWCGTSTYHADAPLVPMQDMVVDKKPWNTLTGRQQYYVDAPLFLETGEELPVHKDPPASGGLHPFTLTCGHTRHSVHTVWRDLDSLLRLQRGEPVVYLNPGDARERGIEDHDYVEVWNDLGAFVARAMITPGMRPRQVHIYHAWDSYQFATGSTNDSLSPSPLKVTQLVNDWGHLRRTVGWYEPNGNDRDTRVDVRKAAPPVREPSATSEAPAAR